MAVPDWKDFSGKGYLGQLQTYVSNNAKNYGIVFANDIAGHRTVPTKLYLASIPDPLLSASKNNNDNDAIGQLWYVPGDGYYQLKDWATRHNENLSAWEKVKIPTKDEFDALVVHKHAWADITSKPDTFTPAAHKHAWADITSKPDTFTPAAHNHAWADITGKPDTVTPAWADITGKPDTFTPAAHNHAWADITGKPTEFTPTAHNHAASDINSGTLDKARMPANVAYTNVAQSWTKYQDFTAGAGNSGSDMRFKQNVKLIKPVLDKLMKLDIISYIWEKEGEQKRDTFGINANQLKNLHGIFEKIIHERNDEDKTLWVEYDRFGVLAIKGIQEIERKRQNDKQQLLNKIQNQVRRIESLEKENQTLRRKQKDLENRIKKIELLLR